MDADGVDLETAARRHGLGRDAAEALFAALVAGGGQAQFNHPALGGMGQWSGGMVQIGDMFNDALKASIGGFCAAMAEAARAARDRVGGPAGATDRQAGATLDDARAWWPADLGTPAATGAQNGLRYACFPDRRRLVVEENGRTTLYDTGPHRLTGFAQQQGGGGTLAFTGPDGPVSLDTLSVVPR